MIEQEQGWIKLHRSILKWEWFEDSTTFRVWVYLLLSASHKPFRYRGMQLQAGQYVTGRKKLAKTLKLSERSVRTALEHLKSTNEITTKSTNRFSIITICNYEKYQSKDIATATSKSTIQLTSNRPATDQQPTTDQELKEFKNVRTKKRARARSTSEIKIPPPKEPVYPSCVYVRLGRSDIDAAENYYRNQDWNLDLIPYAARAVDAWLHKPDKLKLREKPSHLEYIVQLWAMEKGSRLRAANGSGSELSSWARIEKWAAEEDEKDAKRARESENQ